MEEGNSESQCPLGKVDSFLHNIGHRLMNELSDFVAFLFLLFTIGSIYGAWIVSHFGWNVWFLGAPVAIGLLAYYNRTFAMMVFGAVMIIVIIL